MRLTAFTPRPRRWPLLGLSALLFLSLAALLLTGGGSPPTVEAQSFSGITETPSGSVCEADVESETTDQEGGPCTTRATSLAVSLYVDGNAAVERRVYVTGGTQLPNVKTYSSSLGAQRNVYQTGTPSYGKVGVDRHTLNFAASTSATKRSKTFTVTKSMANARGDVYLFVYTTAATWTPGSGSDALNNDIGGNHCLKGPNNSFDTPLGNYPITASSGCAGDDVFTTHALSLDGDALFGIRVKFLEPPVVGRDGPDRNNIIEDFSQCVLGNTNTSGNFHPDTTDIEGETWDCDDQGQWRTELHDETDDDDLDEIRSKLVAYVAESSAGAGDAKTAHVLDGTNTEITVRSGQNEVELYAFINDRNDNYLPGAKVTFHTTSEHGSVRSSTVTEVAKSVVSTISATRPAETHIAVPFAKRRTINAVRQRNSGGTFNNPAKVSRQDDIALDNAVALRTFSSLPSSTFRISVRVTADGVNIGTIVIARPDATPPRPLSGALVKGNVLRLEFNENLDRGSAPEGSAFSVTVRRHGSGGATRTLSGTGTVEISGASGQRMRVTLDGSVRNGDVVYVSYTKPDQNPLRDAAGNAVRTFSDYRVRNFTPRDISDQAPTFVGAEVSAMTLLVTFNENLDTASRPAAAAFRVTATTPGGVARTILGSGTVRTGENRWLSSGSAVYVANKVAQVTLRSRVFRGERVTVSYTKPDQNPLQDNAGNAVETFTGRSVTNSTSFVATRAVVNSNKQQYNQVRLEFDKTLNSASVPPANSFSVTLKHSDDLESTYSVTAPPAIAGSTVTLNVNGSLLSGVGFTVTYTKPSSGSRLQDTDGTEVQSFTLTEAGTSSLVACSEWGYWLLRIGGVIASLSDVPCDMAKPGWNFGDEGEDHIVWRYSEENPEPPVNQSVESVIYTAPDQPGHRVVRGDDNNCYREERVRGKWQRSISYGADEESCRQAIWNTYNRWKEGRAMVNPDGGTFPSGPPPAAAILDSAAVDGKTLTLTFDQSLDAASKPSPSAFTVTANNARRSVASGGVAIAGSTVTLTLTSAVIGTDTVTAGYTKRSTKPLKGSNGIRVETFSGQAVTNNTPHTALQSAAVNEKTLTMTFDQTLDTASEPLPSAFTITVNNARRNVASNGVAISGTKVTLTLASAVAYGDTVTAGYTKPSANRLQSGSGIPVETFADRTVTNNSPLWSATLTTGPSGWSGNGCRIGFSTVCSDALSDDSFTVGVTDYQVEIVATGVTSASQAILDLQLDKEIPTDWTLYVDSRDGLAVSDATRSNGNKTARWNPTWGFGNDQTVSLNLKAPPGAPSFSSAAINGTALTVTFNESLDTGSVPAPSDFHVTVGSARRNVASGGVAIDGAAVTLTLASAVISTDTVKVRYTKPSANPLQDTAGNDVETFADQSVTNNTGGSGLSVPPEKRQVPSTSVTGVSVVSDPGADQTYGLGDTIQVRVTFNQLVVDVDTSGGTPRLKIDMDPAEWGEKWASYASGSGTASLIFTHTVVEPNISTQGIAVLENTLELNGGTIRSDDADAGLPHTGLAHDANHKVDWQASSDSGEEEEGASGGSGPGEEPSEPPANSPATGAPAITGTARVGETLTANTSGIADADGLTNANFSYQWLADGSDISGATGSTYAPAGADVGKAVKVRVSFTDDAGNSETLTSAATAAVAPNPPDVTGVSITSDPGSGDTYALGDVITISVTFDEAVDVTGAPRIAIDMDPADWGTKQAAYQGGSGSKTLVFTHTVVEPNYSTQGIAVLANSLALNGGDIESKATDTDADLSHDGLNHDANHKVDWQQSPPPANSPATGAPAITGTARVGKTLTANTSGIADADGLTGASFSYQWLADGGDISGATGSTYTLASADVGKAVKVRVSFTDDAGNSETLTSAATAAVAAKPPEVTAVKITSDPGSDDTYALGDVITISVTFDEAVDVTGAPRIAIDMDPADWGTKQAAYQGGSGSKTLVFTHTVVEPNYSTQGIAVLANSLQLNGGDIESKATDADLSHTGLNHDSGHKVDWQQ